MINNYVSIKSWVIRILLIILLLVSIAISIIFIVSLSYELAPPGHPQDFTDYTEVKIEHTLTGIHDAVEEAEIYIESYLNASVSLIRLNFALYPLKKELGNLECIFDVYNEKKNVVEGVATVRVSFEQNVITKIEYLHGVDFKYPKDNTESNHLADIITDLITWLREEIQSKEYSSLYHYDLLVDTSRATITTWVKNEENQLSIEKHETFEIIKKDGKYSLLIE